MISKPRKYNKPEKRQANESLLKKSIIRGALANKFSEVNAALADDPACINQRHHRHGYTALHVAASKGNLSMVKHLLAQEGIDILIKDRSGCDALDLAILTGHQGVVNALFAARAELIDRLSDDTNAPTPNPQ